MAIRTRELDQLIGDHGKTLGLVIGRESGAYNPVTGSRANVTPSTETFQGYIYHTDKGISGGNTTVKSMKRCLMLAGATATVPTSKHEVSYLTNNSEIMSVETVWSGSAVVFYIIHLAE